MPAQLLNPKFEIKVNEMRGKNTNIWYVKFKGILDLKHIIIILHCIIVLVYHI